MNTDRLRQVANRIELEDRFNYQTYVGNEMGDTAFVPTENGWLVLDLPADLQRLNGCGTTGCVAGWAGLLALEQGEIPQEGDEWGTFAARWLELDQRQADRLFMAEVVPEWYNDRNGDDGDTWNMNAIEVSKMLRQIADGEISL